MNDAARRMQRVNVRFAFRVPTNVHPDIPTVKLDFPLFLRA
jgi:hypothetical protein